jgi:hypothetical protein
MSLCGTVPMFQRNIVSLYSQVKDQVDEEVTLNNECTMFLCNFRNPTLQHHIPVTPLYNNQNPYYFSLYMVLHLISYPNGKIKTDVVSDRGTQRNIWSY